MFAKPEANNCLSIITQVLSNSVVKSVNEESIPHILLLAKQGFKQVFSFKSAKTSYGNFLLKSIPPNSLVALV